MSQPSNPFDIRGQRPEPECMMVMDDYEHRTRMQQWLLNWAVDSDAYAEGTVKVSKMARHWKVEFRDQAKGYQRTMLIPRAGTPAPPGHE